MELIDIMLKRRSVRKFKTDSVPDEKLEKILNAALLAPTSRNRNPCKFVLVKNREVLKKLSKAKKAGAAFLADAFAAVAVFADENKADTWVEDSSIALTYMMLEAEEQGIGNCWCQLHMRFSEDGNDSEKNARDILSIPGNYRIVGILGLGIPDEKPEPKKMDDLDLSKIVYFD
jgi:nitroreductase